MLLFGTDKIPECFNNASLQEYRLSSRKNILTRFIKFTLCLNICALGRICRKAVSGWYSILHTTFSTFTVSKRSSVFFQSIFDHSYIFLILHLALSRFQTESLCFSNLFLIQRLLGAS